MAISRLPHFRGFAAWRGRFLLLAGALAAAAVALWGFRVLHPSAGGPAQSSPASLPPLADLTACTGQQNFPERIACYRPILEANLAARGPRAVLASLDALQSQGPAVGAHCHDMAHVLGRYWVASGRSLADGFRDGSNVCHSGFFHGMVERVIRGDEVLGAEPLHVSPGELREKAPRICTGTALGTESRNIRFQCLHGLGHAIVFSLGYRLPLALETCDALADDWDRRSCYGGAVMENITGVDRDRRMLRPGDAHYPCSALAEKYRDSCYLMQTSWMLEMGYSFDAIATACRAAGPHRLLCFKSLGRDLSPRVRQEGPAAYATRCAALPADERTPCIQGAVYALADHTWDGRYAYPFCGAFADQGLRAECFTAAQGHLRGSLERSTDQLAADCRAHAASSPECLTTLNDPAYN